MSTIASYKTKLFDWYQPLPPWGKVLVIVLSLGVVVGIYATISNIIKGINNKKKQQKALEEVLNFGKELEDLNNAGITQSFSDNQYRQWADSIVVAFSGCDASSFQVLPCNDAFNVNCYSESGKTVFNIINTFKNDADFMALQTAFSVRSYPGCSAVWGLFGDKTVSNVTLSAAIADELNTGEVAALNKVLASKNVSKKF